MMDYSTRIRIKDKGYQFIITYKDEGRWKTKSQQGFKKSSDAKLEMKRMIGELEKMTSNRINPDASKTTFKAFTDMYIKDMELHREPNTVRAYKTVINKCESIYVIPMINITNIDIQKIINDMIKKGLSSRSVNDSVIKLGTIFKAARYEYQLIYDTPIKNIKVPENKDAPSRRALTNDEVIKLLVDFKDSQYYLVLYIAAKCGMRVGEILGLTWNDIDEKNSCIHVNRQWKMLKDGTYGFGVLKSKNSKRKIPVSIQVINHIKAHRSIYPDDKLFNFKNTLSTDTLINQELRKKGYDITVHALRHTYATMLIANGVDFKTAAKLLGHTVEQTMRTYSHVNDDMMKKATKIISEIFI